ncbi:TPA: YSIRK-type signal peptide-containing protein [Streptococcus suis]
MKRKKSFDWYATKQRFSIRKYHFGVASVLLGVALATVAGAETSSAQLDPAATKAELVPATAETPVAEPATTDTVTPDSVVESVPAEVTAEPVVEATSAVPTVAKLQL